jgi:predicted Zn-dependent peptidase
VEATTSPEFLDDCVAEVTRLLHAHAERVAPVDLERARNQLALRSLDVQERPFRRLEEAAQDLFVHGRVRPRAEWLQRIEAVTAEEVRAEFERMLAAGPAVAIAGMVPMGWKERVAALG